MIFDDRFQNSQHIRQPSLTATSTRMLRCPQRAAAGTYLGEERQRGAWVFGSGFFWGLLKGMWCIYIHLRKIDRFFVFTPKKVYRYEIQYVYIYKCTIMSLSFGYIKEQISETWRMPYDWNHDRSRGQPRVAWSDPRWAMGLVDYS